MAHWKWVFSYIREKFGLPDNINLVICGRYSAEKNAVVQSILGQTDLGAALSPEPGVKREVHCWGCNVSVVELPALSGKPLEAVMQQCLSCISLCGPEGVHSFILVLPVGPLTNEDKAELKTIQDTLGCRVNLFTMILFTVDSDSADPARRYIGELSERCGQGWLIVNMRDKQQLKILSARVNKLNLHRGFTTETLVKGQLEKISAAQRILDHVPRWDQQCHRIVLIGKTGSGKSSSGNTILGRAEFNSKLSAGSVTKVCQKAETEINGRHVAVVDTPGLFDTEMTPDEVNEEILKCISLLDPGPHVFLWVLEFERFTKESKDTFKLIKQMFGKKVEEFIIILVTHGDEVLAHIKEQNLNTSIEDFIESHCHTDFQDLISKCGIKYHVFKNKEMLNHTQVTELMTKIDDLVKKNEGNSYTTMMLLHTMKETIKKQKAHIEKERQEKKGIVSELEEVISKYRDSY